MVKLYPKELRFSWSFFPFFEQLIFFLRSIKEWKWVGVLLQRRNSGHLLVSCPIHLKALSKFKVSTSFMKWAWDFLHSLLNNTKHKQMLTLNSSHYNLEMDGPLFLRYFAFHSSLLTCKRRYESNITIIKCKRELWKALRCVYF